ncbi:hypothetical protein LINPERPRIM_LOCUS36827 [Linum perenne]
MGPPPFRCATLI